MQRTHWHVGLLGRALARSFVMMAVVAISVAGVAPLSAQASGSPPSYSSITPTAGPDAGGTSFTLSGSNFTGVTAVTFGGVDATSVTVVNDTTITGVTPAGADGAADVTIESPNGNTEVYGVFTFSSVNLSATTVTAGGTLTVSGVTSPGASVSVSFDKVSGSTTADATTGAYSVNLTPIKAVAAGYPGGGNAFVVVKAGASTISTSADTVTVTQSLSDASQLVDLGTGTASTCGATPATGCLDASLSQGTAYDLVTLIGSGSAFSSVNDSDFVGTVGSGNPSLSSLTGPYVTFSNASGVQYIAAWVWAGQLGAKWVLYSVSGGAVGSPQTAEINGTYTLQAFNDPAITGSASVTFSSTAPSVALSPTSGPEIGGTSFTLIVASAVTPTGVTFGANAATGVASTQSTSQGTITTITGVTPAGTPGAVDVVIGESSGSITLSGAFTYTALPVVTTDAVTGVTSSGATVNGTVANSGSDVVTTTRFCYSSSSFTSGGCQAAAGTDVVVTGTSPYSANLAGLASSATYYVELEAYDSTLGTWLYGGVQQFTTASASGGGGGGGGAPGGGGGTPGGGGGTTGGGGGTTGGSGSGSQKPPSTLRIVVRFDKVVEGHGYRETSFIEGLRAGDHARIVSISYVYIGIGRTHYRASTKTPTAPGLYRVVARAAVVVISPSKDSKDYRTAYMYRPGHLLIVV